MIPITPATKVAELLERWPELEPVLVAQAPAFQKLRNPVLRRTIARVASLEQAAGVAGISVRELVAVLRRAAGQPIDDAIPAGVAAVSTPAVPPCRAISRDSAPAGLPDANDGASPSTGLASAGVTLIDADALLDAGQVPLKPIFDAAAALGPGESLAIVASFRPVPLIEKLEAHGHRCTVGHAPDGRVCVTVTAK